MDVSTASLPKQSGNQNAYGPKGDFRLCYKNAQGILSPCPGVRYRIVQLQDRRTVATGTTDQDGRTQPVVGKTVADKPTLRQASSAFNMVEDGGERYELLVWNAELSSYIEPDLDPEGKRNNAILVLQSGPFGGLQGLQTEQVLMQRYLNVRFRFKQGNKPIAGAPFVAYTHNADGKQITATDIKGKPIKGTTNRRGETGKFYTRTKNFVVFNLPGAEKLSFRSEALEPRVTGADLTPYEVNVKSQVAVASQGEGTVAKVNGKVSAPAVLNAQDEELILLTPQAWKEFEAVSGYVESTFSGVHQARYALNQALQARDPEAIKQAEKALNGAEDKVAELLNKDFAKKADLVEVVTFESYDKGKTAGDGLNERIGLRRRYLPRKKYEEYKQRRIKGIPTQLQMTSAKVNDGPGSAGVEASGTRADNKKFDSAKFRKSLGEITSRLKKGGAVQTDAWLVDMLDLGGNQFADTAKKSDYYNVDTAAQWMRCAAGAGAASEASWEPKKGKAKVQASVNAQAKLILFEGKWVHTLAIPSVKGWQMCFGGMDLGAIVFQLACELYGFAGAKAAITGAVGVAYAGNKAKVKPQPRDRGDSLASNFDSQSGLPRADLGDPPPPGGLGVSPRVVPAGLNETPPEDINGMQVKAELFAGVEGGLTPSGELQWLPPNQSKPVSFAKLSLDVAVNAGAGASAQLNIFYAKGKFRIKASARLCWGVGAKGALDFVVDADGMQEFVKWVYYQLAHAGFKQLVYIAKDAFRALSQILFLTISKMGKDSEISRQLLFSVDAITESLDRAMISLEKADNRNSLAISINKKPDWLIYATPETRGMLLYALTHHDWASHWNDRPELQRKGWDIQVHYLNEHKQAVLNVIKCVNLWSEWENMMQHISINGSKIKNYSKAEGDVLRLLNWGISLNPNLKANVIDKINANPKWKPDDVENSYLQEYLEHRIKLMGVFPKGYEVTQLQMMDAQQLASLDGAVSPSFAQIDPQYLWLDREGAQRLIAMEGGSEGGPKADTPMA